MEKGSDRDRRFMERALSLAGKGRGGTFPNPMVGAVVVRDNNVVGDGYHRRAGGAHAEIAAIEAARGNADQATLYVNLEPCNHYGNTPPCTEAIIAAGISRVVCSMEDPNPCVKGKGLKRLSDEVIEVSFGIREEEARRLNEVYSKNIRTAMPFVALKIAQSLDGRIATRSGDSKWITGEESRRRVHELRNEYAAVVVGAGTVEIDDPLLTVRDVELVRAPLRVILDTDLKMPAHSRILESAREFRTLICTAVEDTEGEQYEYIHRSGATVSSYGRRGEHIDLREVLVDLFKRGVPSLLVEGGARVFTSFLAERLVDKLYLFFGPMIMGGGDSYPSFRELGVTSIRDTVGVDVMESSSLGRDVLITGYPEYDRVAREAL